MRRLAGWSFRHRWIVVGAWLDRILPRIHVEPEDLSELDELPALGTQPVDA